MERLFLCKKGLGLNPNAIIITYVFTLAEYIT